MKIAVFIKNNKLTNLIEERTQVVIFNMQNEKVVAVENNIFENRTPNSILIWLYHKAINQIYLSEIDDEMYDKIKSTGVQVKTAQMLKDEKLYNTLALSPVLIQELT